MLALPHLISAPVIAPELLRPISIRRLRSSKHAILIAGSSSRGRRLIARMRGGNVVEMAGVGRFGIDDVVEDSGERKEDTGLRREWASVDFEASLNRSSKWLVAALFGLVILWKHDAEALWAAMGSVVNAWLSTILKRLLNQDRPSSLTSDPGLPSSHSQSIFNAAVFSVVSVMVQERFDFHKSGQSCSHRKITDYLLRTKVKLEDGVDDEACELVNGTELLIGESEGGIRAHLFKAVKNNNGTGLLLLSDTFGFEDSSTRDFAYRIACNGYNVLVPDLFRGDPWKKWQPESELERWLARQNHERVAKDIEISTEWMIDEFTAAGISKKLGVIGICFGGGHLIETLAKESRFGTGVCFYGTRIRSSLAEDINVPVLFICGDSDPLCPVSLVSEMEKKIEGGSRAVIYSGRGHGFAHRPETQEEDRDADDAFNVLRNWLKDRLILDQDNAVVTDLVA